MSRIRSRGNARTELAMVRVFRAHGITGWRRHLKLRVGELRVESRKQSTSPRPSAQRGKGGARTRRVASQPSTFNSQLTVRPDFVFRAARLAVFVDGCFWHGCPRHGTRPKGNAAFWRRKFAANRARDRRVNRALRRAGWRVLRIWEHTLRWATTKRGGRKAERGMEKAKRGRSPLTSALSPSGGEGARRAGEGELRLVARLRRALGK